jgi:hypothetical protein
VAQADGGEVEMVFAIAEEPGHIVAQVRKLCKLEERTGVCES